MENENKKESKKENKIDIFLLSLLLYLVQVESDTYLT